MQKQQQQHGVVQAVLETANVGTMQSMYERVHEIRLNEQDAERMFAVLIKYCGEKQQETELTSLAFWSLKLFALLTMGDDEFQDVVERQNATMLQKLHLHQHVLQGNDEQRFISASLTLFLSRNIPRFENWKVYVKASGHKQMQHEFCNVDPSIRPSNASSRLSLADRLPPEGHYYEVDAEQVCSIFQTSAITGITTEEAVRRRTKYGLNQIVKPKKPSYLWKLIRQFLDFMMIILIVAAIVSASVGEYKATIVLGLVVIFNAIVGFVQDIKAEKALAALLKLNAPQAMVLRNSVLVHINAEEIVPGDIAVLEEGTQIPADIRLVEEIDLHIIEALLTGESEPVEKDVKSITSKAVAIADQRNMGFMSTVVTKGRGKGVVVATGKQTEIGKISKYLANQKQRKSPLQRRLTILGIILVIVSVVVCGAVIGIGIARGYNWLAMIKVGVSLAVSVIPEGLVAVTTVCLALGVQRMSKKNAIVRSLPAVETLGSITIICSDKTGTLTEGKMSATEYATIQDTIAVQNTDSLSPEMIKLMVIGALCNNATLQQEGDVIKPTGDATEIALQMAAMKYKLQKSAILRDLQAQFVNEFAFDSDRKRMTVIYSNCPMFGTAKYVALAKGAAESILSICSCIQMRDNVQELTLSERQLLERKNVEMSKRGLRVLALAYRPLEARIDMMNIDDVEINFVFAGFVGILDPPRQNVADSIQTCAEAGIKVAMITGDNPFTAKSIAETLRIIPPNTADNMIIKGKDIDELVASSKLHTLHPFPQVFARVSPENKHQVVKALQTKGEIVAMIGDGANDSTSIKAADVGVAMGLSGTDIAKQSASIVLVDDNFQTIVEAIKEGRRIFDNISKFIMYLLSCNLAEILVMFLSVCIGIPIPFTAIQILYANLIADVPPSLSLGVDPAESNIMTRSPRNAKSGIFSVSQWCWLIYQGCVMCGITLAAFSIAIYVEDMEHAYASTYAFVLLTTVQLMHSFHSRSLRYTIFVVNPFSNPWLIGAVCLSMCLLLAGLYIPAVNTWLDMTPLWWFEWIKIIIAVAIHFVFIDTPKLIYTLIGCISRARSRIGKPQV